MKDQPENENMESKCCFLPIVKQKQWKSWNQSVPKFKVNFSQNYLTVTLVFK